MSKKLKVETVVNTVRLHVPYREAVFVLSMGAANPRETAEMIRLALHAIAPSCVEMPARTTAEIEREVGERFLRLGLDKDLEASDDEWFEARNKEYAEAVKREEIR